jgi:hypothetical protein
VKIINCFTRPEGWLSQEKHGNATVEEEEVEVSDQKSRSLRKFKNAPS